MKRALIVAIVFGVATIALFVSPAFLCRSWTIGKHDVDLSKSGETLLPVPNVTFCCDSELLLFLNAPVESDRNDVAEELLDANLACEILVPDKGAVPVKISGNRSWSGLGATKRLFLGSVCPPDAKGISVRLKVVHGCSGLSGVKQSLVMRQTRCVTGFGFRIIPFLFGGLATGVIAAIALIVALAIAIKRKFSGKKPDKAIDALGQNRGA